MRNLLLLVDLIGVAVPVAAQDRAVARLDLPEDVRVQVERILADPTTVRVDGPYTLESDVSVAGSLVVFGGPAVLSGRVGGHVVVVGSNADLGRGALISGDLIVAGGEAYGVEHARILGTVTMYGEGFRFFGEEDEIVSYGRRRRAYDPNIDRYWGRSSVSLRTGVNYNRVEGLPIQIGPVLESGGSYRTRVQAMVILRTGAGGVFDSDHMGFDVRLEQFFGRAFRLGAGARSVIVPIEPAGVSNLEASLSTFLFHNDLRDYYEREGFSIYARYAPRRSGLDATVAFESEDHESVVARDPWTLFGDNGWRLQPAVGEGTLHALNARVEYDSRDDENGPTDGWRVRADFGRGLGGNLTLPASRLNDSIITSAVPLNTEFNRGNIDVRLYRRFGYPGTLNFRLAAGGSLDDSRLPPQFQHALGGAGSLPGHDLFSLDCGARSSIIRSNGADLFGAYGCDRYVLGSVEFRSWFDIRWNDNHELDAASAWVVFVDAARGWATDESRARGARNSAVFYDAGAGIVIGGVGIYAAMPLNRDDRGVNFFVRLGQRF